jgi:signal transduction histidine kinase
MVDKLGASYSRKHTFYNRIPVPSDSAIILTAVFSVTTVVLGLFLFFVLMMVRNHRKIEAAQRERIRQMQLFSEKLQSTREEEQKRIARELHDELGGYLTSLKYDFLWLEKRSSMQYEVTQRFQAMRDLIDSTIKTVQRISSELRPKILDNLGLSAAVEWQVRELKKRTGIDAHYKQDGELPSINEAVTTGVYRIVQEALTNVARHSGATVVEVIIQLKDGKLQVEITDNGKGLDYAALKDPESLGLLSMQERARIMGGEITIMGNTGKGTRIFLRTPLQGKHQLL